jgi:putative ABC transport system substrate-binding protein
LIVLLLAAPLVAEAQPAGKVEQSAGKLPRIGVLMFIADDKGRPGWVPQGLRDHGYIEGQNVLVEWRSAEGSTDRANALAAELVRLKVGVIVAEFTPAVLAAKNATKTIPIVMARPGIRWRQAS